MLLSVWHKTNREREREWSVREMSSNCCWFYD